MVQPIGIIVFLSEWGGLAGFLFLSFGRLGVVISHFETLVDLFGNSLFLNVSK